MMNIDTGSYNTYRTFIKVKTAGWNNESLV